MRSIETLYTCDRCHTKTRAPFDWVNLTAMMFSGSDSIDMDLCVSCQRMTASFLGLDPNAFSNNPPMPTAAPLLSIVELAEQERAERVCQLPDCGCDGTPHEM
jgi:hypothetical protein